MDLNIWWALESYQMTFNKVEKIFQFFVTLNLMSLFSSAIIDYQRSLSKTHENYSIIHV